LLAGALASPGGYAASNLILNVEGIKGEAQDKSHGEWIDVLSFAGGEPDEGVRARIEGNMLMLMDSDGNYGAAKSGEYKLRDGRMISVKDGNVENVRQLRPSKLKAPVKPAR
jgi:hypothetical protein